MKTKTFSSVTWAIVLCWCSAAAVSAQVTLPKFFSETNGPPITAVWAGKDLWTASDAIRFFDPAGLDQGKSRPLKPGTVPKICQFTQASGPRTLVGKYLFHPTGMLEIPGLDNAEVVGACPHPGSDDGFCVLVRDGHLLGCAEGKPDVVSPIFDDLPKALGMGHGLPHCRALAEANGRIYVANDADFSRPNAPGIASGRLAEWDWRGAWRVVDTVPYVDIVTLRRPSQGGAVSVLALGYDSFSALLNVWQANRWQRYRLPHAAALQPQPGQRICEIGEGKWLLRIAGTFFLVELGADSAVPSVLPLSHSPEPIRDFCQYRDQIVLAGGSAGQSLLRLVSQTELALGPKPHGQATLWRKTALAEGFLSEPVATAGYARRTLHFTNHTQESHLVDIEVDPTGKGQFHGLVRVEVPPLAYLQHIFPAGYSAKWIRVKSIETGNLTAELTCEP
jgi:hypothetical protein